jgi:hypothetical protein
VGFNDTSTRDNLQQWLATYNASLSHPNIALDPRQALGVMRACMARGNLKN